MHKIKSLEDVKKITKKFKNYEDAYNYFKNESDIEPDVSEEFFAEYGCNNTPKEAFIIFYDEVSKL